MAAKDLSKKKKRKFNELWLREPHFSWLLHEDGKMFCSTCKKAKKGNAFTTGCEDFQRSSLTRHMETAVHKSAVGTVKSSTNLFKSFQQAELKSKDSLVPQLRTIHYMARENISLVKFKSLMDLQKANGAQLSGLYSHHEQVEEMVAALSQTVGTEIANNLEKAKFIGIICDESIDIAVFKKLMIYFQIVVDGRVKMYFGENRDVVDGKADTIVSALKDWLQDWDIPLSKVTGLGSDGAAVMTGKRTGVGIQLKRDCQLLIHVHCHAHRLALAVSQSANSIEDLKKYQETVNHIFQYYNNSAVRYNRLRELQDVILQTRVALKEPHSVRWLSLHQAVSAMAKCWPAVVAALGEDAVNLNNGVANGLAKKVETFSFVAHTCLMLDVLPLFTKLSKVFQDSTLDFDKACTMLSVTRQSLQAMLANPALTLPKCEELRQLPADNDSFITWMGLQVKRTDQAVNRYATTQSAFINELLANLDRRFPEDAISTLGNLNAILNPRKMKVIQAVDVPGYGLPELNQLCDIMAAEPNCGFNKDRALGDFNMFKIHARTTATNTLPDFGAELLSQYRDIYPDFSILMEFMLVTPLNSASCERGFSAQNLLKTKSRNRLTETRMNELLRISINGPHFATFDYVNAAENFRAMRERNK